jgi:Fe(3+) dicitrate transport protein
MPTLNSYSGFLALAALLLILPVGVLAQSTSSISGRVLDQNSAAIQGALVTLRYSGSNAELNTTTDQSGVFRFKDVPVGQYRLSTKKSGFATFERAITTSDDHQTEDTAIQITLEPGAIAESVVISASHLTTSETLDRIPGSVDIIDAPLLEKARAFTSTEILRKVAGLNVRDEEGFGLRPNIGIRGLNPTRSTKVLLLEDGIPLTYAPYGDNASYYHPPIDRFESVEVLKGSGQILYGPQTIGGVVNYITPSPPGKREGSITVTGGNRNYFNGHLSYGDTLGNTGLILGFTRKQGQGSRENVRSGLNDFNLKSVTTFNTQHAITFKLNYYGENSNATYSGLRENEFRANPRQNPFRNDFFYGDSCGRFPHPRLCLQSRCCPHY